MINNQKQHLISDWFVGNMAVMCAACFFSLIAEIFWIVVACRKPYSTRLKMVVAIFIGLACKFYIGTMGRGLKIICRAFLNRHVQGIRFWLAGILELFYWKELGTMHSYQEKGAK